MTTREHLMTEPTETVEREVARSAVDGRFVTPGYAAKHPRRTVVETIEYPVREPEAPSPFTLRLAVDCADLLADPRVYPYNGWNDENDQGPRSIEQINARIDEGPYTRLGSCPLDHDVQVWHRQGRRMITFPAGSFLSAGASLHEDYGDLLYGAVEFELRAVQPSDGTRIAAGLIAREGWQRTYEEADWPEVSGDGDDIPRQRVGLNLHYADGGHRQHHGRFPVNMLDWHTYRLEWTPQYVRTLLDDELVDEVTDPTMIPDSPMLCFIQTALQSAGEDGMARPGTTPGGVDVRAWRVYDWTPEG